MKFSSLSRSHIHLQMRIHSPSPHKFPTATCSDHFFNYFTLGLVSSCVHFLFTCHVACDWIHWCEWEKREQFDLFRAYLKLLPLSSLHPPPFLTLQGSRLWLYPWKALIYIFAILILEWVIFKAIIFLFGPGRAVWCNHSQSKEVCDAHKLSRSLQLQHVRDHTH